MKIVCPTCSADYTIAEDMLGPNGRKVKCATCANVWHAVPEPESPVLEQNDASFEADDGFSKVADADGAETAQDGISDEQAAIDRAMSDMDFDGGFDTATDNDALAQTTLRARREEDMDTFDVEEIVASGPVDAGMEEAAAKSKGKSRVRLKGDGPSRFMIVLKMSLKIAAPIAVAAGLFGLVFTIPARESVVRAIPDTARLYAMIGLPVNVRGVEFSQFTAERSMVSGLAVLTIEGSVINVVDRDVSLGPMRLALMGAEGQELFVWRVEPAAEMLNPEQSVAIASELTAPPPNVNGVAVRFLQDGERLPGQLR